ncbi:transmembrane protein [Actinidia rufa]|uniref:Transmembrane protein n=1 Tax=Actinidia rufa TaxID=165716 RepID=A0A7J0GWM8_9ERIC|nr:transmembrane protein [Actinidia rufa]
MGGSGCRGGGRGMIRTVRRSVAAGGTAQESISHSTVEHRSLRLSPCSSPTYSDDFDWECIDGTEDERESGSDDDSVFGSVPSKDEVQHALSSLHQLRASSSLIVGARMRRIVMIREPLWPCLFARTRRDWTTSPVQSSPVSHHLTLRHLLREIEVSLEINGSRISALESTALTLRRDRLGKESSEVTYVSNDSVKLTGAVEFEVTYVSIWKWCDILWDWAVMEALGRAFDQTSFSKFMKGRLAYSSDKDVADEIASPTAALKRVSSFGKKLDWIEPSLHLCNPRTLQCRGSDRVYDAFHLLHTDPSIQRMVMSLSSDKAVWNAVLNNEVVRGLRESLIKADNSVPENTHNSTGCPNVAMDILSGIFGNTKAKVMEIIRKIAKVVNELFQPPENEKTRGATDPFEEKLRTSFVLSIVVLLIVVACRVHSA